MWIFLHPFNRHRYSLSTASLFTCRAVRSECIYDNEYENRSSVSKFQVKVLIIFSFLIIRDRNRELRSGNTFAHRRMAINRWIIYVWTIYVRRLFVFVSWSIDFVMQSVCRIFRKEYQKVYIDIDPLRPVAVFLACWKKSIREFGRSNLRRVVGDICIFAEIRKNGTVGVSKLVERMSLMQIRTK